MWTKFEHATPPLTRLKAALEKRPVRVHLFSQEAPNMGRTIALSDGLMHVAGRSWQVTRGAEFPSQIDVLLLTAHGGDLGAPIWNLRRTLPNAFVAVWFFDNHLAYHENLRTAIAADGYFPSHAFCADHLHNPHSVNLGHLPAACVQWTAAEIAEVLAAAGERSDKFLAGFVDYPFSVRHEFLQRLRAVPEAELLLMPPNDRSRYRSKTRAERVAEWCGYKTSVVLPVERDLSIRLFDALASGQIPLVADSVLDLDRVIPPSLQETLPVLRFRMGDVDALLAAHRQALQRFDAEGQAGIWRRHDFVAKGHFLTHRIASALSTLAALAEGRAVVTYQPVNAGLVLASLG
jgi:hypothetical protein